MGEGAPVVARHPLFGEPGLHKALGIALLHRLHSGVDNSVERWLLWSAPAIKSAVSAPIIRGTGYCLATVPGPGSCQLLLVLGQQDSGYTLPSVGPKVQLHPGECGAYWGGGGAG